MQTEKDEAAHLAKARSFDLALKDAALRALIEYTARTGHRWSRIRNEILSTLGIPDDDEHLLVRQDLEHWAKNGVLGDDKFALVLRFLTHEATLSRPEFSHVAGMLDRVEASRRIGAAMADYCGYDRDANRYGKVVASYWEYMLPSRLGACTFATNGNPLITVSFIPARDERFLMTHAIHWMGGALPERPDEDMHAQHFGGYLLLTPHGCKLIIRSSKGVPELLGCEFGTQGEHTLASMELPNWLASPPNRLVVSQRNKPLFLRQIDNKVVNVIANDLNNRWSAQW